MLRKKIIMSKSSKLYLANKKNVHDTMNFQTGNSKSEKRGKYYKEQVSSISKGQSCAEGPVSSAGQV